MDIGTLVRDRRCDAPAHIVHVLSVPETHDLFGRPIPKHRRLTLVYSDGRWANDRLEEEVEVVSSA